MKLVIPYPDKLFNREIMTSLEKHNAKLRRYFSKA
jgi:hypothetical protein